MHLSWGMSKISLGKIAIGALVVAGSFFGVVWAMNRLWPAAGERRPALAEGAPLPPVTRTSLIVTPAAIALTAIRDAMETAAPRDLTGKRENPLSQLLSNAEIGWTVTRSPLVVGGRADALVVSTVLTGTFRATGQLS